jgi:hypothetical protein
MNELEDQVRRVIGFMLRTHRHDDPDLLNRLTEFAVGLAGNAAVGMPFADPPKALDETPHPTEADETLRESVRHSYRQGGLIDAILLYRRLVPGTHLREAKAAVKLICGVTT